MKRTYTKPAMRSTHVELNLMQDTSPVMFYYRNTSARSDRAILVREEADLDFDD